MGGKKLGLYIKAMLFVGIALLEWFASVTLYGGSVHALDGIFNLVLIAGFICLCKKYNDLENGSAKKGGFILGVLFGILYVIGGQISEGVLADIWTNGLAVVKFLLVISGTVILWIQIFSFVFYFILHLRLPAVNLSFLDGGMWKWISVWAVMFLCYIPCYISFFPGNMSYDSKRITEQALGLRPFDNFQPFFHTIIWTAFIKLEQAMHIPWLGVVAYSIVQMLFLTGVFTYTLYFMNKWKANSLFTVISFLFYAFCPTIVLFSFITTKDILFGGFVLLFLLQTIKLATAPSGNESQSKEWRLLWFFGVLSALLRNNMVYVLIVSMPLFLLGIPKKKGKIFVCFGAMVVTYLLIVGPLYGFIGVESGYKREMLSVPLSQQANVVRYHPESISKEEYDTILRYMPDAQLYQRKFADPIKYTFNEEEYKQNKSQFWKLWFKLLIKEPAAYVDAFLALNAPLWYVEDETVVSYIEVGTYSRHYAFEWKGYLPKIRALYMDVAEYEQANGFINRMPIVRQLFSVSTPIWVLIIVTIVLYLKRQIRGALPFVPIVLLWMTYLLGPVSNFRYIFPIIIAYPIIGMLLMDGDKFYENDLITK